MPPSDPTPQEMPGLGAPLPELRPESAELPVAPSAQPDSTTLPLAPKAAMPLVPTRELPFPDPVTDALDADDATATEGATELEPEATSATEPLTESATPASASIYPGQSATVRAPGWDHSAARTSAELRGRDSDRQRPVSAPELQPASAPSLTALPVRKTEEPSAATPPPPTAGPPSRRTHSIVDEAARELARAALAAEIEREEKKALRHYQIEEGEIPPSPEVAKRFDVILQLGKGGMGVVYLCRDPRGKGKVIAVKDIRTELKPGMKVEQRVEHEAKLLKELNHPGIVKVYDFLKFPRGSAIVMEYIDGLPLDHEIGAGRRITWEFGVRVLKDIGAALGYAHERGVIHRDIKPDNILFSERHNVMKLVDFGLARMYGEPVDIHLTRTGMVVGTPHYMSPE
ncbi:MAG: protein kinase, partial [Planctomycetes bacterium]|nr:protein kinase [Planctomycetota bacterium]